MTIQTEVINIGLNPNDGTGDSIRNAFIKVNQTFANVAYAFDNAAVFNDVNAVALYSNTISTGSATVQNLNVTGGFSFTGNLILDSVTASTAQIDQLSANTSILSNVIATSSNITNLVANTAHINSTMYIAGDTTTGGNLTIGGDFTVLGHVNIASTNELLINNSKIELGLIANTAPTYDDNSDKGVVFHWYDITVPGPKTGFFGYQDASHKFVFIPNASPTSNVGNVEFSGAVGDAMFGNITSTGSITSTTGIAAGSTLSAGGLFTAPTGNITTINATTISASSMSLSHTLAGNVFTGNTISLVGAATTIGNSQTGAFTVVGGVGVTGDINLTSGSIYVNGVAVATGNVSFAGGAVPGVIIANSSTVSTSVSTGALTIPNNGGLGVTGNVNVGGNVTTSGTAGFVGNVLTAAQPHITSVGTLTSLSVTTSVAATSLSAGSATISGQINTGSLDVTNTTASLNTGTGAIITAGGIGVAGNVYAGALYDNNSRVWTQGGLVNVSQLNNDVTYVKAANITGTSNQINVLNTGGNIALSLPQNINTNNTPQFAGLTIGASGINPLVNSAYNLGASILRWGTVYAVTFNGTATNAQYADLAEKYDADDNYPPGTVVVFGGQAEITASTGFADPSVAGVISEKPAYLMNSEGLGLPVALRGKVPVFVNGPVRKGDLLVTDANGCARSVGNAYSYGACVFAKSIEENLDSGVRAIMAVIL